MGHLAKDCPTQPLGQSAHLTSKNTHREEKRKKEEKPFVCYNCGGRGHSSQQCSSNVLFCGVRGFTKHSAIRKMVNKRFQCKGIVAGQLINDIVLDTGIVPGPW